MHMSFSTQIKFPTGFTVSFIDSRDPRQKNRLLLPLLGGHAYVPSSTMRGRFRHTATRMIIEARARHQLPKPTLAEANWWAIGGVKQGKSDTEEPGADMMRHRPICMRHPWSFWGFSDPLFQESKIQIEHARPTRDIEVDLVYGQRSDPVLRGEFVPDHVADPTSFDEYFDRIMGRRTATAAAKVAKRNKNKPEPDQDVSPPPPKQMPTNMPFSRQIVTPGAEFSATFDIRDATEVQVGMFVATLREFAKHPVFGAQAGMNLGLVDMSLASQNEHINIDSRQRSFDASAGLVDLEKQFWDKFPDLDFSIPVLKQ